ncbi:MULTISPECIES: LamG domain-containing protein [unclassified Agarivorans]|uniref:LamG domain-containing protein n=1 Tax=unclassified Agarivorans TaxID=2636026 RepID=UPI0026E47363|nr:MULTISPECIES: LamG-like jellyroll fold domain-containing protein [unclassified Agarivorans]MDO6684819.1 LamG-like jellyroll fold domain-containing protein [Agarivorans sp. 3_MG-2023]MDO6715020.1 LamG-like jellyroll fold domain-containing protein [Agarivorans sp. 2_MG-2023]
MKASKLLLIPMSTTFMFGCFDAPEVYVPPAEPTYAIEDTDWNISSETSNITTSSTEYAQIYNFENDVLKIYSYDETKELYTYTTQAYTVSETTIAYGTVDGTYVVDSAGALTITYTLEGVDYNDSGAEVTDETILAAIAEAEKEPTPGVDVPTAAYEWDFSTVDADAAEGDKVLQMSKADDNPRAVVTGAVDNGSAVSIEQSTTSGSYGYHYTVMDSASDPLAAEDGVISMEITFKADDASFNADMSQDLQLLENTDSNKGWKVIVNKSTLIPELRIYNGDGSTSIKATSVLEDDTYMHLVATYNGTTANIYVNGKLEGTAEVTDYIANTKEGDKVYVGGGSNSSQKNLAGAIDSTAFWLETLTAEQVAERAKDFGFGDTDPDVPAGPSADFEWNFASVDAAPSLGAKVLQMSKADDNARAVVDGAVDADAAVSITQTSASGLFGYHYTVMDSTTDPLAAIDGVISMEIVYKSTSASFNADLGQDLQLLENTDSNKGWKLLVNKGTLIPEIRIYNSTGSTSVKATSVLTDDTYQHLVATYDGTTASIYVNGVLEGSAEITDYVANTKEGDKVYVGGGSNSSQKNLDGAIDNTAFWLSTLTAEEVAARAESFGFTVAQ